MFMDITSIGLFDRKVGMACGEVRHRCSWISLVFIHLIENVDLACTDVTHRCS